MLQKQGQDRHLDPKFVLQFKECYNWASLAIDLYEIAFATWQSPHEYTDLTGTGAYKHLTRECACIPGRNHLTLGSMIASSRLLQIIQQHLGL
ncbi:hypothetical protein TsFJ059_004491 [Trichoderma semiorbis]|uniref:Uncharacterized protein n=1 Tax=Trichoderma semiorbis TaxID=1491008 RepID=A0A9P8HTS5_9HYPO|nr:hypothetical protein TsFJ059_004491 [Trichoderma semiorbis]